MEDSIIVMLDGKETKCKLIGKFTHDDIHYVIYTDGSIDDKGEEKIYASRYTINSDGIFLMPIEKESEWDLIDEFLQSEGE